MFVVDASVWVNGFDQREAGHETSRQFLDLLRVRQLDVVVPNLVLVEVAAAISRTRKDPARAEAFATALARLPHVTLATLDETRSRQALLLASQYRLRGADAVYAAVAIEAEATLVSLDGEHLTHLINAVAVVTPSAAIASIAAASGQGEQS